MNAVDAPRYQNVLIPSVPRIMKISLSTKNPGKQEFDILLSLLAPTLRLRHKLNHPRRVALPMLAHHYLAMFLFTQRIEHSSN